MDYSECRKLTKRVCALNKISKTILHINIWGVFLITFGRKPQRGPETPEQPSVGGQYNRPWFYFTNSNVIFFIGVTLKLLQPGESLCRCENRGYQWEEPKDQWPWSRSKTTEVSQSRTQSRLLLACKTLFGWLCFNITDLDTRGLAATKDKALVPHRSRPLRRNSGEGSRGIFSMML